mgnify:CR=1 FL=1|tara:strand:- start:106 stop:444 length:339 start_codon:yes stop_codon:yes gene_type:complete
MKYTVIGLLFVSLNAFAIEPAPSNVHAEINCFKSSKKQYLPYARSKNFPQSRSNENYFNCLDKSKKLVKSPKTTTPADKVGTGAAILLNPVGAAVWLIDKAISVGVDKTVNK